MENLLLLFGLCLVLTPVSGYSDSSSSSGSSASTETERCSLCRGAGRTSRVACAVCAGRGYTEVARWVKERETLAKENQKGIANGEKPKSPDEARREQDTVSQEEWWDRNRLWVILLVGLGIGAIVMEEKCSKANKSKNPSS